MNTRNTTINNTNNDIIKLLGIALVFLLTGCNDFLDKNPDNRADLKSPQNVAAILGNAYSETLHTWFLEVMSDNVTDIGPSASVTKETLRQAYYWEKVKDFYQDSPDGYWYSCYRAIAHANHALQAIEEMEEEGNYRASQLNPLKGEALMCRAFNHFMLLNIFAEHYHPEKAASMQGIPYVTEPETRPLVEYTRLSVEEVYLLIEKDMTEGFPLISDETYSHPRWHFNKKAAATFMSRFYLFRGLADDWDKVIKYANTALENNPQDFLREWIKSSGSSFEAFGKEYSRSTNPANFMIRQYLSTAGRMSIYRYTMDLELLRKRVVDTEPHPTKASVRGKLAFSNKMTGNSITGAYGLVKFTEEFRRDGMNANYGQPHVIFPDFVAEEALFNLMEAEVMKENYGKVIDYLNLYYSRRVIDYDPVTYEVTDQTVMSAYDSNRGFPRVKPHYALTEKQQTYLDCLVNIRATEFLNEGKRWFDIKRMHLKINHKVYGGTTLTLTEDDPRRVIPLPEDASHLITPGEVQNYPVLENEAMQPVSVGEVLNY